MSQPYSVKVTVTSDEGATVYALQVAQGDDQNGNVAAAYGLADPLTITQKLATNDRGILAHPEPSEASFALIAPDGTTYASMAKGDPVFIQLYPAASFAGTPVEFAGRVNALTSQPHDLGVLIQVSCIDYLADLAAVPIGAVGYPLETAQTRLNRICDEVALPRFTFTPNAGASRVVAAHTGAAYMLDHILEILDTWVGATLADENNATYTPPSSPQPSHTPFYRAYLVPVITAGQLDPTTPYTVRWGTPWTRRISYAPPLRIANVAGTWKLTADAANSSPSTGAPIVDAGKVAFATTYQADQTGGLPQVTTAIDAAGNAYAWDWRAETTWAPGGGLLVGGKLFRGTPLIPVTGYPTTTVIDSILDASDAATPTLVATFRCPFPPPIKASWNLPSLDWQLWAESGPWRRPELTELLTVARTVTAKTPNTREWVAGLVASTTLTVAGGRPVLTVGLLPVSLDYEANRIMKGSSLGVLSMDSAVISGVTLAQLSTRDTFTDYQLVRGS